MSALASTSLFSPSLSFGRVVAAALTSSLPSLRSLSRSSPSPLSLSSSPLGRQDLLPAFSPCPASAAPRQLGRRAAVTRGAFGVEGKSVLIVNTSSGGHAVIGFWLAKRLRGFGHTVTVLVVGEESSSQMDLPPFTRFSELREVGVKTVWGSPGDISAAIGLHDPFDVVVDNNGKDMAASKPVVDWAQAMETKQFLFVSSAGIYKTSYENPHVEGDPVNEDSGHAEVERYIASKIWSHGSAVFRPQYVTGSGSNKDFEEWFFDRIVAGRPVLIPSPGIQLTVITHGADVADIIASAVNDHQAAAGGVFNAVSGRCVTFTGLAKLCAKAAGMEPKIVLYDPKEVGVEPKTAFPFRNYHFFAEPRAVREKLGWTSVLNLEDILNARFEEYVSRGRFDRENTFELDDKILAALGGSA